MRDQLISFETAKLAKEKGFNIGADCYYNSDGVLTGFEYYEWADEDDVDINAPTQSLLQKWIREKYNMYVTHLISPAGIYIEIYTENGSHAITIGETGGFESFEEALEEGLKTALNLIK